MRQAGGITFVLAALATGLAAQAQTPPGTILAPPLLDPPSAVALPLSPVAAAKQVEASAPEAFTPDAEFQAWISALVRQHLPDQYEKKKNWGQTKRTLDGVSIKFDDGWLKTHRKYKEANDGKWQMYRVELIDPERSFDIRIANLRELDDGCVGLRVTAVAALHALGRQAQWEHGIQLYSVSAEADARVRLTADAAVAVQLDPTRFPPDVHLRPEVTAARVEILDFKLRRISDLDGPLVRALSKTVREELEDKLAQDNAKLVAKLNKAIDKEEPKLKLSAADLMGLKLFENPETTAPLTPNPAPTRGEGNQARSAPAGEESRPSGE
jgi:hypothetical protein